MRTRGTVLAALLAVWPLTVLAEGAAVGPAPAQAQAAVPADVLRLLDVMQMDDTLEVMRAEGLAHGDVLEEEMFPGEGGAAWRAKVSAIYDPGWMRAGVEAGLTQVLAEDAATMAAALEFFGSDLGQKILSLEVEARRVLLDEAAESAARARAEDLRTTEDPRYRLVEDFAAVNDLVEMNVMGALNANLAFYRGLNAGGAIPGGMSEEDMLAEVWGQEDDVRAESADWLFPYLLLAYEGLSEQEMRDYLAFSETAGGKALNAAVFAAFDAMFVQLSQALGRAAADVLAGSDI